MALTLSHTTVTEMTKLTETQRKEHGGPGEVETGWEPLAPHVPEVNPPSDSAMPCAPVAVTTKTLKPPSLQLPAQNCTALVAVDCVGLRESGLDPMG